MMLKRILKRRWFKICAAVSLAAIVALYAYHRAHPLVFGESFFGHQHCIKQATASLLIYATDHGGTFPHHTNGFGDALLLVRHAWLPSFTGPGYSTEVFEKARASGGDVPEDQCGRIYVQGLSETNDARIAIIFDRIPSPGIIPTVLTGYPQLPFVRQDSETARCGLFRLPSGMLLQLNRSSF